MDLYVVMSHLRTHPTSKPRNNYNNVMAKYTLTQRLDIPQHLEKADTLNQNVCQSIEPNTLN